jgi:hypothetical protein
MRYRLPTEMVVFLRPGFGVRRRHSMIAATVAGGGSPDIVGRIRNGDGCDRHRRDALVQVCSYEASDIEQGLRGTIHGENSDTVHDNRNFPAKDV